MKPEYALILSFYKEIAVIDETKHVFLVQHIETKQLFVKKILFVYDKHIYEMLKAKCYPDIPQIFHCVEDDGKLVLIEEYIKGWSLASILEGGTLFSVREAAELICKLCDILSPLHKQEPPLIHRDIKPSNVLISSDRVVKLIDFNAAKEFDELKIQDTILLGTIDYAAPEQYGFGQSDVRTDIYGLGVLLNQTLTGKFPKEQRHEGDLAEVIKTCTDMEPERRYQSVDDLKQALLSVVSPKEQKLRKKTVRDFRPPGFRGTKLWGKLLAGFGYAFAAFLCMSMTLEEQGPPARLYLNRIFFGLLIFGMIAFLGNYMGIQKAFPLMKQSNPVLRVLGYLLGTALILIIVMGSLVIIESVFWPEIQV